MDYTLREWVGMARLNGSIAEAAVQVQARACHDAPPSSLHAGFGA